MSEQKPITKVPDGQTGFYTTVQKPQWHCFTGSQYAAMSGQWQMPKLPVHRIVPGFELLPRAA